MSVVAFVGPSLPEEMRFDFQRQGIDLRAPAARGEISAAAADGNAVIALIDGVMIGDYGPSVEEVYEALEKNTVVFGAASIGALRATELCAHGMIGIGWVYKQFVSGALHRDPDLLSLLYGDRSGLPLTIPQINVIYGLRLLVRHGRLSISVAERVEAQLRDMSYLERSPAAVGEVLLSYHIAPDIHRFIVGSDANIKVKDALLCLTQIARLLKSCRSLR